MKGTKLLTSIAALALVVGLGGCSEKEQEEVWETTSESWSEAMDLIAKRGAAISSWTGLDGFWDTKVEIYVDMTDYGLDSDWFDYMDSYSEYDYVQMVTAESGAPEGVYGYDFYSDYYGNESYCLYLDGVNAYEFYEGEVASYPGYASLFELSDFAEDLVYLMEDSESGLIYDFQLYGLYIDLGLFGSAYTISGSLEESDWGNQRANVLIEWNHDTGTSSGYTYDDTGFMNLLIEYDEEGEISLFLYDFSDYTVWDNPDETDITTQTISYQPFDGEIETPEWLA